MRISVIASLASLSGLAAPASAGVTSFTSPVALEAFVGGPLAPVPDDGLPVGTVYGDGFASLETVYGPMSFDPVHDKVAPGVYHPFVTFPLAGSDVIPPTGATAFDLMLTSLTPVGYVITGVGSMSSSTPIVTGVLTPGVPFYVGFVATDETLDLITIETEPFGTTPPMTWHLSDLRLLPAPAGTLVLGFGTLMVSRRRRAR